MSPKAFIDYLVYFHCLRDYFECHEVLEEYWKDEHKQEQVWVGLIQVAVAMYHHRRDNFVGAERQLNQAIKILEQEHKKIDLLGINYEKLINILSIRKAEIKKHVAYSPIDIPIKSEYVIKACLKTAQEKGCSWGNEISEIPEFIKHKHKLRDRSYIIEERKRNLKKNNRD